MYDLGFTAGQANKIEIFNIDLEGMVSEPLGDLRKKLGISVPLLRHLYSVEHCMSSNKASQRIPAYYNVNPAIEN